MHEHDDGFSTFLGSVTSVTAVALCPDVRLHLAADLDALWVEQERWLGRAGLAPPYWAIAWPGGQALARHLMDTPGLVRGRSVLDLGSGSGLVAITASLCSARCVDAADTDPYARKAIAANAALNRVEVATLGEDVLAASPRWDVVLAGDLWYERFLAARATAWLRDAAAAGASVLLGDAGRAFFPRGAVEELCRHDIPSGSPEQARVTSAAVWRLHA